MSGETLDLEAAKQCIERERALVQPYASATTGKKIMRIFEEMKCARAATDKSLAALIAEVERLREALSRAYERVDNLDGEPVQFVGCYVMRWGRDDEPTVGFRQIGDDAAREAAHD